MSHQEFVMRVRFRSRLSFEDVTRIAESRATEFEALAGLQQKYYLREVTTGEYAGLYIWRSRADLEAFRESELRASIGKAYQVEGEPDLEIYEVFKVLRERG